MKNKGITLIALVITIIVLLILAGITLSLTLGENGILQKARTAKIDSEIAREKEQILLAMNSSFGENGKNAKVIDKNKVEQNLQATEGKDNVKVIADIEEDDSFYVKFIKTNRYYEIDLDRNVTLIEVTGGEKNLKLICVNSTNTVLFEKTYIILKDNFSKKLPEIEGYMPPQERITGTITQDEEMKVTYYFVIPESDLIFVGLDKNGNITNDPNKIDGYMLGDNTNSNINGIVTNPSKLAILQIPEMHNGKPVKKIGAQACNGLNIVRLIIPDSIINIGKRAFYNCIKLTSVTIGNGVNKFEIDVFSGDINLVEFIYNNESDAIKAHIFNGCNNLKEFSITKVNSKYKIIDGVIYSNDGKSIERIPPGINDEFKIKDGTTNISKYAFEGSSISGVVFNSELIKIDSYAFNHCDNLENVDLTGNINIISDHAFFQCHSLKSINIGENINSIGTDAFTECTSLEVVNYNNEGDVIKGHLFNGCNALSQFKVNLDNKKYKVENNILLSQDGKSIVKVPVSYSGVFSVDANVTSIEQYAFDCCRGITGILGGENLNNIDQYAFNSCTGITNLILNCNTIGKAAFKGCSSISNLIINNGVTNIGENAFENCTSLGIVTYNNESNAIKSRIFAGCSSLSEFKVNTDNTVYKVENNILLSYDGKSIVKVPVSYSGVFSINSNINSIDNYAFSNCIGIEEISIGENLNSVGKSAFYGCTGITELILNCSSIDKYAFRACGNLSTVIISNKVTSIQYDAFLDDSNLKTVIIDSSTISSTLTSQTSCGNLVKYATTVYTKSTPGSYITSNFNMITSDKPGYTKYVKK